MAAWTERHLLGTFIVYIHFLYLPICNDSMKNRFISWKIHRNDGKPEDEGKKEDEKDHSNSKKSKTESPIRRNESRKVKESKESKESKDSEVY